MDSETDQLAVIKKSLTNEERLQFDTQYASRRKSPGTAVILSVLLGVFGVDRFYLGQIVAGFLKLFTLGGLFLWAIIDWFLISGDARWVNKKLATSISHSLIQMRA